MVATSSVVRDSLTLKLYAVNGASAFFFYSVGPATALIGEDLGVSAQAVALHGTAMAASMLTVGLVTAPMVARFGRRATIIGCLLVMAMGVLVVVLAPTLLVSLVGTYLAGASGAVGVSAANAQLTVIHPQTAPAVLTEASAAAAWVGLASPLLMGGFLAIGLSWRVGLAISIPMSAALALSLRGRSAGPAKWTDGHEVRTDMPRAALGQPPKQGFPPRFWVVMLAVFATAGAELAVSYWGATLLRENTGASAGTATAAMSAAVAGVAIGRTFGARLTLRLQAHHLLVAGWLVALAGFIVFWRAGATPAAVLGLLITGVGLSVTFPLLLDRSVLTLPGRPDRALSTAMAFVGLASGLGPLLMGALAARFGVQAAFALVPGFIALGLVAVLISSPATQNDHEHKAVPPQPRS
jgi:predicted MFS family arabinose efflux permease